MALLFTLHRQPTRHEIQGFLKSKIWNPRFLKNKVFEIQRVKSKVWNPRFLKSKVLAWNPRFEIQRFWNPRFLKSKTAFSKFQQKRENRWEKNYFEDRKVGNPPFYVFLRIQRVSGRTSSYELVASRENRSEGQYSCTCTLTLGTW